MKDICSFLFLLILWLLMGCGCNKTINDIPVHREQVSATVQAKTPSPDVHIAASEEIVASKEIVPPSSSPTRTASISPSPTPNSTPIATISVEQKAEYVHKLNSFSGVCPLPCWSMIIPGETLYTDAYDFLLSISTLYAESVYWRFFLFEDVIEARDFFVDFSVRTRVITQIHLREAPYTVDQFLAQNGIPEEIWVFQDYDMFASINYDRPLWPLRLALFYPSKGILGVWTNETITLSANNFKFCPGREYHEGDTKPSMDLYLWQPGRVGSFSEMDENPYWIYVPTDNFFTLKEVAGIENEEFYWVYKDPENIDQCFSFDVGIFYPGANP